MSIANPALNTTSLSSNASFIPSAQQFFCQLTKNDTQCISSAQFSHQPFDLLCPSGDCWSDCQDLTRLFAPFPIGLTYTSQIHYGTPPNVTFWPLCAGLANITHSIQSGQIPAADTDSIKKFFSNNTEENVRGVAAATTQCFEQTCSAARYSDRCAEACESVNLLQNRTSAQLAGTTDCIRALCDGVYGLPFANQDVVGIGVSASYVIQNFLVVLIWVALVIGELMALRRGHRTKQERVSKSWDAVLDGVSGFHAAQCYFSIPVAIAAFFGDPFTLDPLNAFALLPVSVDGFLPVVFTLVILAHYRGLKTWYAVILTNISFILNSVLFWAVYFYLQEAHGIGAALKAPAYKSLGGIDVCGGMTALALCLQFQDDSPPAVLVNKYGSTAWTTVRIAPLVWAWGALSVIVINIRRIAASSFWDNHGTRMSSTKAIRSTLRWLPSYWISSGVFMAAIFFECVMFYAYITLDLTNLTLWSFGQVVAIVIWVPPLVDYLHLQFDTTREEYSARLSGAEWKSPSMNDPLLAGTTPHLAQAENTPTSSHPQQTPHGQPATGVELGRVQHDRYRPIDSFADEDDDYEGDGYLPRPNSAWSNYEQRPASPHNNS